MNKDEIITKTLEKYLGDELRDRHNLDYEMDREELSELVGIAVDLTSEDIFKRVDKIYIRFVKRKSMDHNDTDDYMNIKEDYK